MQTIQQRSVVRNAKRIIAFGAILVAGLMLPRSAQPESGFNGIARMRPGDVVIGSHPQHEDPSQYLTVQAYSRVVQKLEMVRIQREKLRAENKRLQKENARLKAENERFKGTRCGGNSGSTDQMF